MKFHAPDLMFVVMMIGVVYFMIFLPKRREQQAFAKMIQSLKKGDRVMTNSGMYGEIAAINGEIITLKFHDGMRIDFNKTAISKSVDEKAETEAKAKA
jgi:preprotein translocase subunit YajC